MHPHTPASWMLYIFIYSLSPMSVCMRLCFDAHTFNNYIQCHSHTYQCLQMNVICCFLHTCALLISNFLRCHHIDNCHWFHIQWVCEIYYFLWLCFYYNTCMGRICLLLCSFCISFHSLYVHLLSQIFFFLDVFECEYLFLSVLMCMCFVCLKSFFKIF